MAIKFCIKCRKMFYLLKAIDSMYCPNCSYHYERHEDWDIEEIRLEDVPQEEFKK